MRDLPASPYPGMMTYRLVIEYDGGAYYGWQIQTGQPTVQEALEGALAIVFKQPIPIVGSGRTDRGVHARGQVGHCVAPHAVDLRRLQRSLNGLLPAAIAVVSVSEAPEGFHARYDARSRRYRYYVSTGSRALDRHCRWTVRPAPDFETMNRAAAHLVGTRHFGAFCRARSEARNRICTVRRALWVPENRSGDWYFEIIADRFLHGMVRAIVGTLLDVGHGRRDEGDILRVLASEDRKQAGAAAPPHGLVLEHVGYSETLMSATNREGAGS